MKKKLCEKRLRSLPRMRPDTSIHPRHGVTAKTCSATSGEPVSNQITGLMLRALEAHGQANPKKPQDHQSYPGSMTVVRSRRYGSPLVESRRAGHIIHFSSNRHNAGSINSGWALQGKSVSRLNICLQGLESPVRRGVVCNVIARSLRMGTPCGGPPVCAGGSHICDATNGTDGTHL
jgi:hypothetical protein